VYGWGRVWSVDSVVGSKVGWERGWLGARVVRDGWDQWYLEARFVGSNSFWK